MTFKIVAIDGPSGVGKSSITSALAQGRNLLHVDTGAMFRCLSLLWDREGNPESDSELKRIGAKCQIDFPAESVVTLNGEDVSALIRTEHISSLATKISQFPVIREILKDAQRDLVQRTRESEIYAGAVLEGRDIGTVVFPDADYKFFVDASPEVRAKRRHDQLLERGDTSSSLDEVLESLRERDHRDRNREVAPLIAADDADIVDTGPLDLQGVVDLLLSKVPV